MTAWWVRTIGTEMHYGSLVVTVVVFVVLIIILWWANHEAH